MKALILKTIIIKLFELKKKTIHFFNKKKKFNKYSQIILNLIVQR